MKAALLMSTFNKNDQLPNTLYSIARQRLSFPLEICIVDDCSEVDPEPIVRHFLPQAKYVRLTQKIFGTLAQSWAFTMISPDVDVVVLQSCDVIHLRPDTIEMLCRGVAPRRAALADVIDHPVDNVFQPQLFEAWSARMDADWQRHLEAKQRTRQVYQGPLRHNDSWFFFLGAILKRDLLDLDYQKCCCDVVLNAHMKERGFTAEFVRQARGVHASHPAKAHFCLQFTSCPYQCRWTKGRDEGRLSVTRQGDQFVVKLEAENPA